MFIVKVNFQRSGIGWYFLLVDYNLGKTQISFLFINLSVFAKLLYVFVQQDILAIVTLYTLI